MKRYQYIKFIMDYIIAVSLTIVLFPLLITIGLIIRADSRGPIFFTQERLGKDGRIFQIYKFRTMVDGAIKMGNGLSTFESDPRITNIGRFLRKTSMDELPQIINVLKGDMSFIGPRPPVPYHPRKYEEYSEDQKKRFKIRPGITGYAQVKVRNSVCWDERIVLDGYYVDNMSLPLDVSILVETVKIIIARKNIYKAG